MTSNRWFNDVIIDCYMSLLSSRESPRLLTYTCSWFNTLFYCQNPDKPKVALLHTEHRRRSWFDVQGNANYDFVIIPSSLLNAHFIVVVIDLCLLCIYVCDSLLSAHNNTVSQVARYLYLKYFMSTGTAFDSSLLSYTNYCVWDKGFPKQVDAHSCGPYVCIMCKCIAENKLLRFTTVHSLHRTILHELLNSCIL